MRNDFLKLRGAASVLDRAMWWIDFKPWQPDWSCHEMDKSGRAAPMEDAYQILRRALWNVQRELER